MLHSQLTRYHSLFKQYAVDSSEVITIQKARSKSHASLYGDEARTPTVAQDVESEQQDQFKPKPRSWLVLGDRHLMLLLPHVGPALNLEQAQSLILCYDTSCTGFLDFEDFLDLMTDHETTLKEQKEKAMEAFEKLYHIYTPLEEEIYHKSEFKVQNQISRAAMWNILLAPETGLAISEYEAEHIIEELFPPDSNFIPLQDALIHLTMQKRPESDDKSDEENSGSESDGSEDDEEDVNDRPSRNQHAFLKGRLEEEEAFEIRNGKVVKSNSVTDVNPGGLAGRKDLKDTKPQKKAQQIESGDSIINNPEILTKRLVFHIFKASGLENFIRVKRVSDKGILYNSLYPVARVQCAGVSKQTTALIHTDKPEWNQELIIPLHIPFGKGSDIQQWIEKQAVEIVLLDYINIGLVPHYEWIGSASAPLSAILCSESRKGLYRFRLDTRTPAANPWTKAVTDTQDPVWLEVGVTVLNTRGEIDEDSFERILDPKNVSPHTSLTDLFIQPEAYWLSKYEKKVVADLSGDFMYNIKLKIQRKEDTRKAADLNSDLLGIYTSKEKVTLWSYYQAMTSTLKANFPRRNLQVIGLDENGMFRYLCSFVRPLHPPNDIRTADEAAFAVAQVPIGTSFGVTQGGLAENLRSKGARLQLSGNATSQKEGAVTLLDHAFGPCSSPAAVIFKGSGSIMEHAVFLCDLFLGLGIDAYVAVGTSCNSTFHWVVTFGDLYNSRKSLSNTGSTTPNHEHGSLGSMLGSFAEQMSQENPEDYDGMPGRGFMWKQDLKRITRENASFKVHHWNPITGERFPHGDPRLPFDSLFTLFNNRNVYLNIQKTDQVRKPIFSWNLQRDEDWCAMMTPLAVDKLGPPSCYYAEPTYLTVANTHPMIDNKLLTKQLVKLIQLYRRHVLFVFRTGFHRGLSKVLQRMLGGDDKQVSPGQRIEDFLPNHQTFHYRTVRVPSANPQRVLEHLIWSGLLNSTVPETIYALACRMEHHPWGFSSTDVYIGYLNDLHHGLE